MISDLRQKYNIMSEVPKRVGMEAPESDRPASEVQSSAPIYIQKSEEMPIPSARTALNSDQKREKKKMQKAGIYEDGYEKDKKAEQAVFAIG